MDDRVIPVVERLTGEFPVGRWQCWVEQRDLDVWGDSNKWFRPPGCNIVLHADASVVEFLPDSKGYILGIRSERGTSFDYDASKAFAIAGIRDALFSRVTEIRWSISDPGGWKSCNDLRADGCLTLTTTRHERFFHGAGATRRDQVYGRLLRDPATPVPGRVAGTSGHAGVW